MVYFAAFLAAAFGLACSFCAAGFGISLASVKYHQHSMAFFIGLLLSFTLFVLFLYLAEESTKRARLARVKRALR